MQMPLADKSNERQLCSQALKVIDGIFLPLPPLCLMLDDYRDQTALYSQTLLCRHSLNMEITSLYHCLLVVLKPIHFLDKIDPLKY